MDDIGETVLSMAEIKALASGDPKIMERVMAQNEIMKLEAIAPLLAERTPVVKRMLAGRKEELEQTNPQFATWVLARKCVTLTLPISSP